MKLIPHFSGAFCFATVHTIVHCDVARTVSLMHQHTPFFLEQKNILPVFLWKLQLDLERRWNSIQPVGHSCPRFWYMRHSDYYACSAAYLSSLSLTLSLLPPFRCVSALCLSLCLLVFFSVLGRAATMSRGRRGTTTRYLGAWPLLTSLSLSLSRPHELFSH